MRHADDALGPLAVLLEDPGASAVLSDFDGTLAPIVADPAVAYPLPEAPGRARRPGPALRAGGGGVGPARVVPGPAPGRGRARRCACSAPTGSSGSRTARCTAPPRPSRGGAEVAEVVAAARAEFAGEAVGIEDKGVSVTVHWRQAPEAGGRALGVRPRRGRERTGLVLPARSDGGGVPASGRHRQGGGGRAAWRGGSAAACFAGDDAGDLAAFAALDRLAPSGTRTVRVAVADEETPPELVAAADVVVHGPAEALDLFRALATAGPALSAPTGAALGRRRAQAGITAASWSASQSPGLRRDTRACSASARRARSAGAMSRAWRSTAAVPVTSKGLISSASGCSSANAPASRDRARTPSVVLTMRPFLGHQVEPVAQRVHEEDVVAHRAPRSTAPGRRPRRG